jgi:hypothetical protein
MSPGVASPEEAPAGRTCPPAPSGGASPWRALAPIDGAGTWTPAPRSGLRLTLLGTVVVCLLLSVAFLLAQRAGRDLMCKTHPHDPPRYCASYTPTPTTPETSR